MGFHGPGPRLVIDVETYSSVDLRKAGPHAYAEHPETGIHCLAWAVKGGHTPYEGLWLPGQPVPPAVLAALMDGAPIVAHNWLFEFNIWHEILVPRFGWPPAAMAQWSCTMARALYHGLPASLDDLGIALELAHKKDPTAKENMMRLARPRSRLPRLTWWHDDPAEGPPRLAKLYSYCIQDVAAENEADDKLPELPDNEREVFILDGQINQVGIEIDLALVSQLQAITDAHGDRLNRDMRAFTDGRVTTTNQVGVLRAWLLEQGTPVASLDKEAVADALTWASPKARIVLLIRQEAAKASTAKLRSMAAAVSRDRRARGLLQYYGAGRTGRWAGRRVQPQNLPRPTLKQGLVDQAVRLALAGVGTEAFALLMPGTPMDVVASVLRGCLAAAPGYELGSVDLAQIEARVIAWLAQDKELLAVFGRNEDVYVFTATKIGSDSRQLGKVLVLACGFGMGWMRFQETALTYGLSLSDTAAQDAVQLWRETNRPIVGLWYGVAETFMRIAGAPSGTWERRGLLVFGKTGQAVRVRLPSGRELVYQKVKVGQNAEGRDEITYWGIHQTTRTWGELRTYGGKLVENIVQAVARDIMAAALLKLRSFGFRIVGSIHDEALFEVPAGQGPAYLKLALDCFRSAPPWAAGLPVWGEGWVGERYRKG